MLIRPYTFKITRYTGYFSAAPKGNYTTYYRKKGESVTFNIGVKTDLKDTVYYQWYKMELQFLDRRTAVLL